MQNIPHATVRQLAYKIKGYGKHPRISFLLGAGASRQSGVITAGEMIRFFRERILDECCPENIRTEEEKEKWLKEQVWYQSDRSDYCKFFEQYEPKEFGRQRYIESIIEGNEPSFGYVVLANLMASNYLNTIITTNFDDLVYSACTSYTGIRPIVYAYGVLASEMRITVQRPKILKLHGDYLYAALKNTDSELAMQDPNMARQLSQVLNEYGLVVVGYGGGDKSIMDILSQISDKNDLYWCTPRGVEPSEAVKNFLISKRGFLVEIDGFDEMMNEIRHIVGFDVSGMFSSIQDRQDHMIEKLKNFAPLYSVDILSEIVDALQKQADEEQKQLEKIKSLDFFTKALKAQQAGDKEKAEALYRQSIDFNPNDAASYNNLANVLAEDENRYGEAEKMYLMALQLNPNYDTAYYNLGILLSHTARYKEAEEAYRKAIQLKSDLDVQAHESLAWLLVQKLNNPSEAEMLLRKSAELAPDSSYAHNSLGIFLYLYKHQESEDCFKRAIELNPTVAVYYENLSRLLRLQGREKEALAQAETSLRLNPEHNQVTIQLAAIHKKLGNDSESGKYLEQVRGMIKPDDWYNLACIESICGNADKAIEYLGLAAQKNTFYGDWAKQDPDFEGIRNDPRFNLIIQGQASITDNSNQNKVNGNEKM